MKDNRIVATTASRRTYRRPLVKILVIEDSPLMDVSETPDVPVDPGQEGGDTFSKENNLDVWSDQDNQPSTWGKAIGQ